MGRASNRKKAERQTGQSRKPDLATQRQINRIMTRLQALSDGVKEQQRDEQPGIPRPFQGIGSPDSDALPNLVRAGAVGPADVLPVGLTMLYVLAQLCRSDSLSLL